MGLSRIINYPLGLLGLKIARVSALKKLQNTAGANLSDIEADKTFMQLYSQVKDYTLVGVERCYALYNAVEYILKNKIEGDFVECGVWRGGSCMLIAHMLKQAGIAGRKIWLYDTFAGMTEPGNNDGAAEKEEWAAKRITDTTNSWCLAGLEDVTQNMRLTGYPFDLFRFVEGKVEDTIPRNIPQSISLLRLDTDWYASTKHELDHLYPLLSAKGVLLIDDYGAWQGAKKAVDEYFAGQAVWLNRIDYTGRIVIR